MILNPIFLNFLVEHAQNYLNTDILNLFFKNLLVEQKIIIIMSILRVVTIIIKHRTFLNSIFQNFLVEHVHNYLNVDFKDHLIAPF